MVFWEFQTEFIYKSVFIPYVKAKNFYTGASLSCSSGIKELSQEKTKIIKWKFTILSQLSFCS